MCYSLCTNSLPFFVWLTKHRNKIEGREMNIFTRQVHYLGPGKRRHYNIFFLQLISTAWNTWIISVLFVYLFKTKFKTTTTAKHQANDKTESMIQSGFWKIKPDAGICTVILNSFFFCSFLHFSISVFKYLLYVCMFHGLNRCSVI